MKKIRYIIASALVSIGLCACTDTWDSHYSKWETVIDNTEIQAVDEPAADFLKTAQDYSKMYELFDKTGVIKTWQETAGGEHRHRTAYSSGGISGCTASYVPCFHRGSNGRGDPRQDCQGAGDL